MKSGYHYLSLTRPPLPFQASTTPKPFLHTCVIDDKDRLHHPRSTSRWLGWINPLHMPCHQHTRNRTEEPQPEVQMSAPSSTSRSRYRSVVVVFVVEDIYDNRLSGGRFFGGSLVGWLGSCSLGFYEWREKKKKGGWLGVLWHGYGMVWYGVLFDVCVGVFYWLGLVGKGEVGVYTRSFRPGK